MKIFGRGKNSETTAADDDLDVAVDDDAGFDDAVDGGLSAPLRGLDAPRGNNKKTIALLFVLLLAGGGFAAMTMMGGDDAPPPLAMNALPPATPLDPNAPVDGAVPVDMAGMPPADNTADMVTPAADTGMPPMPEMPPMPAPVADGAVAPVDPLTATPQSFDPTAPIDPLAVVTSPPDAATPVDPVAPAPLAANTEPLSPLHAPVDAVDADSDAPTEGALQAPAVPDTVTQAAPLDAAVVSVTAPESAPAPNTTPLAPVDVMSDAVIPNAAEQALVDHADMVAAEASVSPAGRTPEDIAQLWASLPVEDAMIRPLPKQYLIVKKEKGAESIDSRLAVARRALNDGRTAAALQFFNDLRNDYPSDTRVLMGRAVTLQRLGENAQALEGYEDVLINDPKNLDALTNMLGLIKQQNPQLALDKLQDLRNLYPYNADITTQLAVAYGQTGNLNEALRYITLAEALKPDSGYVMYNKAVLYDRLGRSAEAADMYRQLIRRYADGTLDQNLPIENIKKRLAVMR